MAELNYVNHAEKVENAVKNYNWYFLSAGKTQTVEVTFKPAKDYPVDLYYLMDLSR